MKEIPYKPSFLDSHAVLTTPNCPIVLTRIRTYQFTLHDSISTAIIFAFKSKILGDYFDLRPNIQVVEIQFVKLQVIEGAGASHRELRLRLSHRENVLLNERDEIFLLNPFTGDSCKNQKMYTAEDIWGITNQGYLESMKMSNRFVNAIEQYSGGIDQSKMLLRFWTDYQTALGNPKNDFSDAPPYMIHGEFTCFLATPQPDRTVLFDLP
ncbi:hypothetical protein [Cerasicoccus fimbriatus]|uniref:hypothetical protein n=1 Tax=Cerasicoccus fimbriatus TaxID=3014554 RepID=UPI0022B33567|nr:hypothetical protein [Cerasicoccus sp. TK19100]